ncbi:hypothetical protein [Sedimenticola selenatireducens]|jgi:hypothetical protein|uniref:Uncharacterized protein n=1 Tax=Sedimenticola selenatireducens TaxID=191960 RepID=A0A557S4C0_9GAMM|nr:hypothetical protein [Sedimenticola selenatireducens]TVO72256.1 hypothetical protein FHP88_13325 [Sedimenticola selenatireducens]TVT61307.1 MAG: hypothetical protein FHK78_18120 [Sedimenticola selenatireducens]
MLIWKGWGILAIIIPLLCSLLVGEALNSMYGDGFYKASTWAMPLVLFLSSVPLTFIGYKLNKRQGRILIDPENNEKVELRETHTMFWIPLQYWGGVITAIAIWMYMANIGLIYQK